jgi:ribonuclease Z
MKPGFDHRLVNGPFEDPCLYVRIPWEKRAILFDLGEIHNLSQAEIHKITDVFVTHTHMDHFIGFDRLLRMILRRESPVTVYGPPGIAARVEGKLRGYSWNLIRDYPAVIYVCAFNGKTLSRSLFKAKNGFKRESVNKEDSDGMLIGDPLFNVRAVKLGHDIPCLAFSLEENLHINIDRDRLLKMGLGVGPWLTEFKKAIREKSPKERVINAGCRPYSLGQLSDIALITKGQKISYATDIAMNRTNLARLIALVEGSDVFYCEAYFLEKDRDRALERFHLTARTCGKIAKEANVRKLLITHISPKYSDCPEEVVGEAMAAFKYG